jgi:hypothetical protein
MPRPVATIKRTTARRGETGAAFHREDARIGALNEDACDLYIPIAW